MIEKAVAMANSLNPDLVVLTGDYVWQVLEAIDELAPILANLNARYGVYSTLGNHDYWLDADAITETMEAAGLPVLVNQGLTIQQGGGSFYLAGLDDGWSGNPDLDATLEGSKPEDPVILLCHEPDLADPFSKDDRVDVQLSGHTHGGQVRLPHLPPFYLPRYSGRFVSGFYQVTEHRIPLYVSRGIGTSVLPLRFLCRPEIGLFEISKQQA